MTLTSNNKRPKLPSKFVQEYLESVYQSSEEDDSDRARRLLLSFAELQYKSQGGARCTLCRAHVRHVLEVKSQRLDGSLKLYDCLCTRCIESEKALSESVKYFHGSTELELKHHTRNGNSNGRAKDLAPVPSAD